MVIGTDGFGLGFREDDHDDRYHERGVSMRIYVLKKSSVIFFKRLRNEIYIS